MNMGSNMLTNIFKTLKLVRCLEFSMCSRYDFEKSYLPQKAYFLIFYMSKINSRSLELRKNIESNLKSHLLFYFKFIGRFRVSRIG